jgi:hypothetical protein
MIKFLTERAEQKGVGSTTASWRMEVDEILFPALSNAVLTHNVDHQVMSGYLEFIESAVVVNRYDIVEKEGAEAFQDKDKRGPVRLRLFSAIQQTCNSCFPYGETATLPQARKMLTRLHELQLGPFTMPFIFVMHQQIAKLGWLSFLDATGAKPSCEADAKQLAWDAEEDKTQKEALDFELKYHANDEREICH